MISPLLAIGFSQAAFASFLMFVKKPAQLSDRLLGIWMLFFAMVLCWAFMAVEFSGWGYQDFIVVRSVPLTFGPFLYLFTLLSTKEKQQWNNVYYLHFIPFLLAIAILPLLLKYARDISFDGRHPSGIQIHIWAISNHLSFLIYTFLVHRRIHYHGQRIKNHFSNLSERNNLKWIKVIAVAFTVCYMLIFLVGLFFRFTLDNPVLAGAFSIAAMTFFVYVVSFFGFRQPTIYKQEILNQEEPQPKSAIVRSESIEEKTVVRYEKSGLKDDEAEQYLRALIEFMDQERPFLDNNISINDLARRLKVPKHYLTQIINERLNKNFYTFINEYRVDEVKRRITDPENANLTLLAIAYDSGFNSKTAFYTIFKKVTGLTPTEYRKGISVPKKNID